MKFTVLLGRGQRRNWLDFGSDPGSFLDPESFSVIFNISW